ncbi:HAD family hydrolase [Streptomyces sp. VRA16 Mangrove soil]|uniref:HAD family hydrolase n=1 Tax=Streptomyces sp. VRA16 Mangrove soil TaxID=2817434 RepID=UPI001A9EBF0C|nr:HAD family hydrolase [Streptomyces sp. VRA16 Mangrove soil]MBO1329675.1 HAD family hydrolase [Streptomyces sp. VRA16 Mangrove soil]
MPLLLLDLDNTLIDRDAAFRAAMAAFLADHGLPAEDLARLMALDADGYTPRPAVAEAMTRRYADRVPPAAIRAVLDHGAADRVTLADPVRASLLAAAAAGWIPVVVTNGRTVQQTEKIRRTGLDTLVDSWVISEAAGHKKPAPEIFRVAAAGRSLKSAWMVGDSAHADIGGAGALGLRTAWVARGRTWCEGDFAPTLTAADTATAIDGILVSGP